MNMPPERGLDLVSTLTRRVLFAPLADHGRAWTVAERLRTAISLGILAENEQLPSEADLAAQFNISPVTLREALNELRTDGLLTTRRGRGGGSVISGPPPDQKRVSIEQVSSLSSVDLRDLADWRRAIGAESARLAARRASERDLALLERGAENVAKSSMAVEARRADSRYFIELASASQSARLSRASIGLQVEYAPVLTLVYADEATRKNVSAVLRKLTRAVRSGQADQAGRAAAQTIDLVAARAATLRARGWED
jgi:DNA-binding FadR family transcriptional regulator